MSTVLRLLLILLFTATVFGQTDTDSVDTTDSGEDTNTNDDSTDVTSSGDDDSDDDSDSFGVTDDSDDSDDDNDDSDDTDSDDDDSDDDDSDDDDSDDTESDDESDDDDSDDTDSDDDSDDTDSDDDSDDDDSDDTDSDDDDSDDTDSDDDSDDDDDDSDDTDSSDGGSSSATTTSSAVSYCASLSSSQCANAYANDGTAICAVNSVSSNCYAVVASQGKYGSGNFDEGWNAASNEMEVETQNLQLIVGVLGGLVALLVLCVIAGGCVFWKKVSAHELQMSQNEMAVEMRQFNDTEDGQPMMTAEM